MAQRRSTCLLPDVAPSCADNDNARRRLPARVSDARGRHDLIWGPYAPQGRYGTRCAAHSRGTPRMCVGVCAASPEARASREVGALAIRVRNI